MIKLESIIVEEESYKKLINLLGIETKINFDYYRRNFVERRIKSRMIRINCTTLEEYYYHILSNKDEITKFIESFNINYSYFFRNWDIFEKFQNLFLDSLNIKDNAIQTDLKPNPNNSYNEKLKLSSKRVKLKRISKISQNINENRKNGYKFLKAVGNASNSREIASNKCINKTSYLNQTSLYKKIRSKSQVNIWSCPCASGEEPYSIAMILDNLKNQIPYFPKYKIVASDIDADAILKAKFGEYKEDAIKEMSVYFENKYFKKQAETFFDKYTINETLKRKVEFLIEDLTKGHHKPLLYDVVFCRYLLIYISRETRAEFIKIIEEQMVEGGLLILGKTETLFKSFSRFKLVDGRDHIYIKI
jgi:chemotaxis protein methyltransferase CheR